MDSSSHTTKGASEKLDERLIPFFQSTSDEYSQHQLEYLLNKVAKPIVQRIVLRGEGTHGSSGYHVSVDDVVADTLLRLLTRLRAVRSNPDHQVISNFDGLVATITYRTVADHLRTRNRQRTNLEKKIRRLFAANNDLQIWKNSEQEILCGFNSISMDRPTLSVDGHATREELSSALTDAPVSSLKRNTADLILAVLKKVQRPIRFRDLVDTIGDLVFSQRLSTDELEDPAGPKLFEEWQNVELNRRLLKRLFLEIQKLEVEQRKALLLNMTDSYGYSIEWFAFSGIATEEELAELLQVSFEEFRQLLDRLPMTDKEIAERLGTSPTKVANIRKAVRDRLGRCRAAFLKEEDR